MKARRNAPPPAAPDLTRGFLGVFGYSRRALELVWTTSRPLSIALGLLTLVAGALPAAVAYVGAQIIDAVVAAIQASGANRATLTTHALVLVGVEGLLVGLLAGVQRGISLCQSLLRAQLGQRVNVLILEKALTLELAHFEDSEFYDKLTRARREASSRPLSLVMRTFGLVQNAVSLVSYGTLLAQFSPWAVVDPDRSRTARLRGRDPVFRRGVSPLPLAIARDAHAAVPRDRARPGGSRQGGQALRPRPALARSLPRNIPQALPGGP